MSMFVEFSVLIVTIAGFLLGSYCIYWINVCPSARQAWWGCCLFVVALLILGGAALLAAVTRAEVLAPLGLLCGILIVAMLWEGPVSVVQDDSPSSSG